jgi:hypothetical protein
LLQALPPLLVNTDAAATIPAPLPAAAGLLGGRICIPHPLSLYKPHQLGFCCCQLPLLLLCLRLLGSL